MNEHVEALLRTLPRKIKVGAYDWRIVLQEGDNTDHGQADFEFKRINLWPDTLIDTVHTVGIVLHEFLHAIYEDRGLDESEEDREEQIVIAYETGLVALLRDNPKLLTWIRKGLK
jgi:hypothetical protein